MSRTFIAEVISKKPVSKAAATTGVMTLLLALLLAAGCSGPAAVSEPESAASGTAEPEPGASRVGNAKASITILTTNAADVVGPGPPSQGEWSFSAWVEVDGKSYLFDTGWSPRNVLSNAEVLGIDLSKAEDVILSHHHKDHTGGLETLRAEMSKRNPKALSRIHVAEGIFDSRPGKDGKEGNPMIAVRKHVEATGAEFIIHDGPAEIAPNVWVTGPVERPNDEKNYATGPDRVVIENGVPVPDNIPESQGMVILSAEGPILVSGCGHAGLINTLECVRKNISDQPPEAAIGGFHLYGASDDVLNWTGQKLAEMKLHNFIGSHCTGFESVYRIRELAGMNRQEARIGAIGTRFETGKGVVPGSINR